MKGIATPGKELMCVCGTSGENGAPLMKGIATRIHCRSARSDTHVKMEPRL